jgi:tetratricopeptide (TPR) repeat protein
MILTKKLMNAIVLMLGLCIQGVAQDSPGKIAKAFIRQGDYNNAILVLNRAIPNDNENIELKKDLAFAYYMQRDFTRSMEVIKPVVDSRDADVQSYQILGMVYKAVDQTREAERMYKTALRKFPESGVLYNDYGELQWDKTEFVSASKLWLRGIQTDQNYPGNYYNAARYYYMTEDKVWGLLYGEMFLNLESYSRRTPEIKRMLMEGYKKLFSDADLTKNQDNKNEFVKAYLDILKTHSQVVDAGITPDALSALRTRFILSWYEKQSMNFPFRLFDYHKQLAKAGMFDAYNQWIFGAASNLSTFQQWTTTHSEEYNKFTTFQRNRVYKVPEGQWYQK